MFASQWNVFKFNVFENNSMFGDQWNVSMYNDFENNSMFGGQLNVPMFGVNRRREKKSFSPLFIFHPKSIYLNIIHYQHRISFYHDFKPSFHVSFPHSLQLINCIHLYLCTTFFICSLHNWIWSNISQSIVLHMFTAHGFQITQLNK